MSDNENENENDNEMETNIDMCMDAILELDKRLSVMEKKMREFDSELWRMHSEVGELLNSI